MSFRRSIGSNLIAIAFVRSANGLGSNTSVFTVSISPSAGDTLVIGVSLNLTTVSVESITDDAGNLYYQRNTLNDGSNERVEIWTTTAGGLIGAATTLTIKLSAAANAVACAAEYSGVNAFGRSSTFTGSSTTPTDIDRMIDANDFIVLAVSATSALTVSANTGNLRTSANQTNVTGALNDNTAATTFATITNTVTLSGSATWAVVSLELKQATNSQGGNNVSGGAFVQLAYGGSITSGLSNNTYSIVLDKPVRPGNLLVVGIRWNQPTTQSAPTSNQSDTFLVAVPLTASTLNRGEMFYVYAAGGATTVTLHPSGGASHAFIVAEYATGLAALDSAPTGASGTGTAGATNAATTTQSLDLGVLLAWADQGTTTLSVGSQENKRFIDSLYMNHLFADQAIVTAGTHGLLFNVSPSDGWGVVYATFMLSPVSVDTEPYSPAGFIGGGAPPIAQVFS